MSAGEDDLFGRWSRRKQAVRREEAEEAAATEAEPGGQTPEPAAADPVEPAEPPPSLDDLTADGDLSAFLREGVPTALRNAAMRKMWSLDPAIRDHVGLSEYAWDFNKPGAMAGFGPLEAGRAVADFLSAVSRAAPADPEPAPPAAEAPDAQEEVASPLPDLAPGPLDMPEEPPPAAAVAATEPAEASGSDDPSPDPPRPRHGGAVPR